MKLYPNPKKPQNRALEIKFGLSGKLIGILLFLTAISCTFNKPYLSSEEKEWLKNNAENIVFPFGYSAPPNAYYNDKGEYTGLLLDIKKEIEQQLETDFKIKHFSTWNELMNYSEDAENFVIVGISRTSEREKYLQFTNPFVKIPYVIITPKDTDASTLQTLNGEKICVTKGYAIIDYLKTNHPELKIKEVESDLAGLRSVSMGTYDAMITNQMYGTHIIEREGFSNLKIAGESGYYNNLCAAVSKKNPELYKIINKAVDRIPRSKQKELYRKWIYNVPENVSMKIVYAILVLSGFTLFTILIMWLWLTNLRKQVGKATNIIKNNEKKYRNLVENSTDAIYILHKHKFVLINKKFEALFGYNQDELLQDNFDTLKLIASEHHDFIRERNKAFSENKHIPQKFEFTGLTKDNKKLYLEVSVNSIEIGNGTATQGIIHDITERKNKEIELLNAKERAEESDRLKSAFLANMSHEIRTPMNGILGFADLLKSQNYSAEQQAGFISIIQKSGERMLSTINNIIDISKIESGVETIQIQKVNIKVLLFELYQFFLPEANQRGVKLIFKQPDNHSQDEIYTDDYKLNSILTNLIKNALKFTSEGSITIAYEFSGNLLKLNVSDTGVGIPLDKHDSIFNYFVQADNSKTRGYEGSGLGLSISKGYVEMLDGDIRMESAPNKGTHFFVNIPITRDEKIEDNIEMGDAKGETALPSDLKVIIAEDDITSANFLSLILNEISSTILLAANGLEAIDLIKSNPDTDVILMDMRMPKMGGLEATRIIREFNENVVIIAQTAFAKDGYRAKTLDAGCNDFVLKPIQKENLFAVIAESFKTADFTS